MQNDQTESIRERAYRIWQAEGCPEGREQTHWLQATQEIMEEQAKTSGEPQDPDIPGSPGSASGGFEPFTPASGVSGSRAKKT